MSGKEKSMRTVLWTKELHMERYELTLASIYNDQSLLGVCSYMVSKGRILYDDIRE